MLTTKSGHVIDWRWSDFTGRREIVGRAAGYSIYASEHEDGTWSWNGFCYDTLEHARESARKAGY